MRWLAALALMLLVGLPALWAWDDGKDEPKEPAKSKVAEEVDALIMAHQKAMSDFYQKRQEKLKDAKTPEERTVIFGEALPKSDVTRDKLLDLVEKNPKEQEAAVTALRWLVTNEARDDESQKGSAKAWDLLIKDYAANPKIAALLGDFSYRDSPKVEELFRAVLEKNPAREAKGQASFYLGGHLNRVASMSRSLKERPEEAKSLEGYLGKEGVTRLKDADPDKLAKEAETLFELAEAKYGDVVLSTNARTMKKTTIADRVVSELFEIRHLAIGKEVPDIVAEDLDGKSFKLSDYRGKVVVLDFWGHW